MGLRWGKGWFLDHTLETIRLKRKKVSSSKGWGGVKCEAPEPWLSRTRMLTPNSYITTKKLSSMTNLGQRWPGCGGAVPGCADGRARNLFSLRLVHSGRLYCPGQHSLEATSGFPPWRLHWAPLLEASCKWLTRNCLAMASRGSVYQLQNHLAAVSKSSDISWSGCLKKQI